MRVAILAPILAVRAGLSALLSASELAAAGIEVVWEAAALADLEPALAQADTLLLTGEALAYAGAGAGAGALRGAAGAAAARRAPRGSAPAVGPAGAGLGRSAAGFQRR